ncbi:Paraquat-inducible protein A [Thioclava sp. SK-1]|uniref:paraquat-inducible protein A n=1 Tax=Thioclava sp. SK-1 TaxID=1889770 RepID=UPI0008244858|nr:paraquat-inducible protein A [Thioclava sp. SK-1]OCX67144.1 Paraquat-inducible protein A [Thioclava sp. SK-1]
MMAIRLDRVILRGWTFALLVLFPVSWCAPLMRAGVLPFFDLTTISIATGLTELWQTDKALAVVVAIFAVVAPMAKCAALVGVQSHRLTPRALPIIELLGRLAMADIFLIALYIVMAKGITFGRVETAWGLYLYGFCVLSSLFIGAMSKNPHPI